jgi:hypothetical protein
VVPEEDEVALIVERHDAPPPECRVLAEERAEHPPDPHAKARREIVEHELGLVRGRLAVALDVLCEDNGGELEGGRGAVGEVADEEAVELAGVLVQDDDISEAVLGGVRDDRFQRATLPLVECAARKDGLRGQCLASAHTTQQRHRAEWACHGMLGVTIAGAKQIGLCRLLLQHR